MARPARATTDDTLFGDTEFALRDQTQGIVAMPTPATSPKSG